jgi:hypothetical protein
MEPRPRSPSISRLGRCAALAAAATLLAALGPAATAGSAERVSIRAVPNGGTAAAAESDGRGAIHLVYVAAGDLFYVRSSDGGATFAPPLRVNSQPGSVTAGAYRTPDVAIGKDGRVHIVWYSDAAKRKLSEDRLGVHYSHLDAAATAFAPTVNLGRARSDNFSVAADGAGRVAVLWTAEGLWVRRSDDGGESFAAAERFAGADPCECCATRARFGEDSTLYSLYRDKADNVRDVFLLASPRAGGLRRSPVSETTWRVDACPMSGASLRPAPAGLIAAWETKGRAYFARLDRAGHRLPPGEIAAPEEGREKYPLALTAADGSTLLAWKSGKRLEWRLYDGAGKPEGAATGQRATSTPQPPAGVVRRDGQFVLFDALD